MGAIGAGAALQQLGSRETLDVRSAKKQSEHSWNSSGCFVHLSAELDRAGEVSTEARLQSKQDLGSKVKDYAGSAQ